MLYRVISEPDVVFRDELERLGGERGTDHPLRDRRPCDGGGSRLLSPDHLRELVPDLDEREVFLCGPPAMIKHAEASLRGAGVPRRNLHIERFAL